MSYPITNHQRDEGPKSPMNGTALKSANMETKRRRRPRNRHRKRSHDFRHSRLERDRSE